VQEGVVRARAGSEGRREAGLQTPRAGFNGICGLCGFLRSCSDPNCRRIQWKVDVPTAKETQTRTLLGRKSMSTWC